MTFNIIYIFSQTYLWPSTTYICDIKPFIGTPYDFNLSRCDTISVNQKQELPVAAMFVDGSGWNEQYL
jgi:hypothetical protein